MKGGRREVAVEADLLMQGWRGQMEKNWNEEKLGMCLKDVTKKVKRILKEL